MFGFVTWRIHKLEKSCDTQSGLFASCSFDSSSVLYSVFLAPYIRLCGIPPNYIVIGKVKNKSAW